MRDLDRLTEKVVIELDNHQVAIAVLGFIVVSTGTFAAGVVAGQKMNGGLDNGQVVSAEDLLDGNALDGSRRNASLSKLPLGTREMQEQLTAPTAETLAADPTEAARIEAHRQLAEIRASGKHTGVVPMPTGPTTGPAGPSAPNPPSNAKALTWVETDPAKERQALKPATSQRPVRYALEVSAFASAAPAEMVAKQLKSSGHAATVRTLSEKDGKTIWRVEVGNFDNARVATNFQREFERKAGYSTVMIPLP